MNYGWRNTHNSVQIYQESKQKKHCCCKNIQKCKVLFCNFSHSFQSSPIESKCQSFIQILLMWLIVNKCSPLRKSSPKNNNVLTLTSFQTVFVHAIKIIWILLIIIIIYFMPLFISLLSISESDQLSQYFHPLIPEENSKQDFKGCKSIWNVMNHVISWKTNSNLQQTNWEETFQCWIFLRKEVV